MFPTLKLVDKKTEQPLPFRSDEPDVQYNWLYHGTWAVHLDGHWSGQIAIVPESSARSTLSLWPANDKPYLWLIPGEAELTREGKNRFREIKKRYEGLKGAAGRLRITLLTAEGYPIPGAPVKLLDVLPSNITEEQLSKMIYELSLMALSETSQVVNKTVVVPITDGIGLNVNGFEWHEAKGQLVLAEKLLKMVIILQREVPRLRARPLYSISLEVGETRGHKALYSARIFQKPKGSLSKRAVISQKRVESPNCSENRFVFFALQRLEALMRGVRIKLAEDLVQSPPFHERSFTFTKDPRQFVNEVKSVQAFWQVERDNLIRERRRIASELSSGLEWIAKEKSEAFWSTISETILDPTHSLRVLGTPSYSAIYHNYQALWGDTSAHLNLVSSLLDQIERGQVRPVWEVYELWCVIFVYYSLVAEIRGLKYVNGELIEKLTIEGGELKLPRNVPFVLEGQLPDKTPLRLRLWYEPQLETSDRSARTPDILLELHTSRSGAIYFVFDCKYRNYQDQGASTLVDDVYGVAKMKYLQSGLRFKKSTEPLDVRACFILHTSKEPDYWGEVPLWRCVNEVAGSQEASRAYDIRLTEKIVVPGQRLDPQEYAGHRLGAISLCVGNPKSPRYQFRRLVYLLLYYFAGEVSFCPHCGTTASSLVDDDSSRGQGKYYLCHECGRFWVEHFCNGPGHHRLIKLGSDSFHRPLDEKTKKWVYRCPECGSTLQTEQRPAPHELDLWEMGA